MRIVLAAIVGAIVLFMWGFVSWMFIGWHDTHGGALPNEAAVVSAIQAGVPDTADPGVYWIPAMPEGDLSDDEMAAAIEGFVARHEAGPVAMLVYRPGGLTPMAPSTLGRGFGLNLLAVLVGVMLLGAGRIGSYGGRVLFMTGLGLFVGLASELIYWNYMTFPTDWSLVMVADHIVGWLLVGLVVAAIVKPKAAAG